MTTNHPERLDPALIRPGRINKRILMGYLQPADALAMVEHYFGATTAAQRASFHAAFTPNVFTPAQVEQLCAEVRALPRPPAPPRATRRATRRATATTRELTSGDVTVRARLGARSSTRSTSSSAGWQRSRPTSTKQALTMSVLGGLATLQGHHPLLPYAVCP